MFWSVTQELLGLMNIVPFLNFSDNLLIGCLYYFSNKSVHKFEIIHKIYSILIWSTLPPSAWQSAKAIHPSLPCRCLLGTIPICVHSGVKISQNFCVQLAQRPALFWLLFMLCIHYLVYCNRCLHASLSLILSVIAVHLPIM